VLRVQGSGLGKCRSVSQSLRPSVAEVAQLALMREKGFTPRTQRIVSRRARCEKKNAAPAARNRTLRPPREKEKGSHYTRHDDDISERITQRELSDVAQIWFLVPCSELSECL